MSTKVDNYFRRVEIDQMKSQQEIEIKIDKLGLIPIRELEGIFGVSRMTINDWRTKHQMPVIRLGYFVYIHRETLEKWIERKKYMLPTLKKYLYRTRVRVKLDNDDFRRRAA